MTGQLQTDKTSTAPRAGPVSGPIYAQYMYGYPHKLAYRAIEPARRIDEIWASEDKRALFLYLHVPFCEQRCGFCNLFTLATPPQDLRVAYVDALERQAVRVRGGIGPAAFSRFAIGGGTPTYLELPELARVFSILDAFGLDPHATPGSVEVSPETASHQKLALLRQRGVFRVSMGVQSFIDAEAEAVRRRQENRVVLEAIASIRELAFPTLNLDLMYGLPGQTVKSAIASVRAALEHAPEELYLYPLYVRPLTILGKRRPGDSDPAWDRERLAQYREARDLLDSEGYEQVSMRMFRRRGAPEAIAQPYQCQVDGTVGLGCGARSYTDGLHYSTAYAVGVSGVRDILHRFVAMSDTEHDLVRFGFVVDHEERRRRFVLLSLLSDEGLDLDAYSGRFGGDALEDVRELANVLAAGVPEPLVVRQKSVLKLTPFGLERSDQIGPYLASARARALALESERR